MTPAPLPPAARLALWLLALDALGSLALALFVLLHQRPLTEGAVVTVGTLVVSAALQGLWWWLVVGLFRGEEADSWNGWYVAYRALYPLLIAWQLLIYFLPLLGVLGVAEGPGTVSWLLLIVTVGGSLLAAVSVYVYSVRLFAAPDSLPARVQLRRWLEWAAIFGLASTVMNVYAPNGMTRLDLPGMLVWGLTGLLDVAAMLLLRRALGGEPAPKPAV